MPHASALLTLSFAGGLAGGVLLDAPPALGIALVLSAAWVATTLALLRGHPWIQLVATSVLVLTAGCVFGAHAVDGALYSPLRALLEERRGGFLLTDARAPIEKVDWPRSDDPIVIEGRVRQDAVVVDGRVAVHIDVEGVDVSGVFEKTSGGVSLGIGGALQGDHVSQWTTGRRIRVPALLRRPGRYLNEGLDDQERSLARRGISLVGTIKSAALVDVIQPGRWWEEAAARIRAHTRRALLRHVRPFGAEGAAIAAAILIGDRSGLSVELEQRLQEAGTYHVIAISGGNIAILAGLLLGSLRLAGVRGRTAAAIGIASLVAYALVVAGGASVLRATVMAATYLAVRLIDQRTGPLNALSLTGLLSLLIEPLAIVDVGFWLTFGATAALIITAHEWPSSSAPLGRTTNKTRSIVTRVGYLLGAVVVGTAAVELVLAPIGAYVFQRVTLAGMLLNVLALPAMTALQIGAMAVVASDSVGLEAVATGIGQAVHVAGMVMTESTQLLDYAPWLTWRALSPHALVLALYYAAVIAALLVGLRSWPPLIGRTSTLTAAALFLWIVGAPQARVGVSDDGRLHLTVIDVGQGDALLATFPNGRTLLIDSGGSSPRGDFDGGDRVVGPALRARQLLAIDYLAVTHGDPDHLGGAKAVLRDFGAREVWWGVPVPAHEPTLSLRREADRQRVGWRTLLRGDRFELGGVEVRVHHPPPPDWERQRVRNDDSLVIELRFGNVSLLLTGDIGRGVEQELVSAELDLLPIVVLKVAHHGSATSSSAAFIEHVRPRVAVLGVGRANAYGHPVPSVLGRLREVGAEVFRTDVDGQIEVVTNGQRVEVETFTGRRFTVAHQ